MLRNKNVIAVLLVVTTTITATLSFYFWQVAKSPNLNLDGKETFVLYIPQGASYLQVVDSLHKHKLIHDEIGFQFLTKWSDYRENVRPGRYEIPPNSGNKEIVDKLRRGVEDPVKLTFNNIRTKDDFVKKIGSKLSFPATELRELLDDEATCQKYGFTPETILSMFLPDTYFILWTSDAESFLKRMHTEYTKFWNDDRKAQAASIQMTPIQVAIMASIVQSETNKVDEMARVAGVYVNRLALNMPLQADPTVKFAVGDFSIKRILEKHLTINSPYNTYRNTGLPPGPIALPERNALKAVLEFEKHNFVYFCAREDFSGYHNFAETYDQHLIFAKKYQNALNANQIR